MVQRSMHKTGEELVLAHTRIPESTRTRKREAILFMRKSTNDHVHTHGNTYFYHKKGEQTKKRKSYEFAQI